MQIPISLSQVSRDCLIISNIDDVNLLSVLLCLCNNQQRHRGTLCGNQHCHTTDENVLSINHITRRALCQLLRRPHPYDSNGGILLQEHRLCAVLCSIVCNNCTQ